MDEQEIKEVEAVEPVAEPVEETPVETDAQPNV